MKTPVAAGFAVFVLACTVQAQASGAIDLNVRGNLEAVERANPEHYAKIQRILAEVPQRPPAERSVASWRRTEFQARDVRYTDLVMTSLPPKKRLAFSLDDTAYVAVVTLTGWGAEPRRVKQATEQSGETAAIH